MNTFTYYNPVRVFFGQDAVQNLRAQAEGYQSILLAYGGGSIKRTGIYDKVMEQLAGKRVTELSGIMPNPRTEKVYEGIELCRAHSVDLILAVGGGSTIDCCKMIAAGAKLEGDFWDTFMLRQEPCREALPIGVVLTMAGTGSETNCTAVVTHWEQQLKLAYVNDALFPKFAVMDPTWTYTLPREQMVSGAIDTLSHIFEVYFSAPDTSNVSDALSEALMKNLIENVNIAAADPTDYTARANMMWCSSLAINTLLSLSKATDWMGHMIEHAVSAFFDVPHGLGLAVVHPNYLKYICQNAPAKFARFAQVVWGVKGAGKTEQELALEGIERTRAWFKSLGAPLTLGALGVDPSAIPHMAAKTTRYPTTYSNLSVEDIEKILTLSLAE